jgi:uncharacterized protein YdcH (DUF465 family)
MWKNYFSRLFNVHNVNNVRKKYIQPNHNSSHLEAEIAIVQLKKYKLPGSDQISAELIQAGGETLVSAMHKLINSIQNCEELPYQWKKSIIRNGVSGMLHRVPLVRTDVSEELTRGTRHNIPEDAILHSHRR